MRKTSFSTSVLPVLVAAVSAFGQQGMTFDIPSEFRVGNTMMPACQYTVSQSLNSGLTDIASKNGKVDIRILAKLAAGTARPTKANSFSTSTETGLTGIACDDCKVDVRVLTNPVTINNQPTEGKLVFNKHENAYFLSSVRSLGGNSGRVLPLSRAESELAHSASPPRTTQILLASTRSFS